MYWRACADHCRILPAFHDHSVVPDAEHTILFGLSLLTLCVSVVTLFTAPPAVGIGAAESSLLRTSDKTRDVSPVRKRRTDKERPGKRE
jgi:hypothetical protein